MKRVQIAETEKTEDKTSEVCEKMKRVHIAVPENTADKVTEIREKMRSETGINETNGSIVAKAINAYHRSIFSK